MTSTWQAAGIPLIISNGPGKVGEKKNLTGFIGGVVVLHQERIAVVPNLLTGPRVVLRNQRLQVRVKDALAHRDIDWRLTFSSRDGEGSLPHRMH